jgi:hypothetical protein
LQGLATSYCLASHFFKALYFSSSQHNSAYDHNIHTNNSHRTQDSNNTTATATATFLVTLSTASIDPLPIQPPTTPIPHRNSPQITASFITCSNMSNAMSPKRKQPHDETPSDAFAHTPVKKLKLNDDETPSNASPHTPVKKLKSQPEGEPTVKKAEAANDASPHTPVEKVKPHDETSSEASAHTPVKKFKLKLKLPRNGKGTVKEVEAANDASPNSSVKKVKIILKLSPPKVTPTAGQKRKSPADDELADNASLLAGKQQFSSAARRQNRPRRHPRSNLSSTFDQAAANNIRNTISQEVEAQPQGAGSDQEVCFEALQHAGQG